MGLFDGLMDAARSVRSKRQSQYYKRLQSDTRRAKLEREKVHLLRRADKERAHARRDIKRMKPKRKLKFIGDLREFAGRIPSDEELNKATFGTSSPKRPEDILK